MTAPSPPALHCITWLFGRALAQLAASSSTGSGQLHWSQATGGLWAQRGRDQSVMASVCTVFPWWAGREREARWWKCSWLELSKNILKMSTYRGVLWYLGEHLKSLRRKNCKWACENTRMVAFEDSLISWVKVTCLISFGFFSFFLKEHCSTVRTNPAVHITGCEKCIMISESIFDCLGIFTNKIWSKLSLKNTYSIT